GDAAMGAIAARVTSGKPPSPPSVHRDDIPPELDALVMRALARDVAQRPPTALALALEIEKLVEPASPSRVVDWVDALVHDALAARAKLVADIESGIVEPLRFDDSTNASTSAAPPAAVTNVEDELSAAPVAVPSSVLPVPSPSTPTAATGVLTTGDVIVPPRRKKTMWALAALTFAVVIAGVVAAGMWRDVNRPPAAATDHATSSVDTAVANVETAATNAPTAPSASAIVTAASTTPSAIAPDAVAAPAASSASGHRPHHGHAAAASASASAASSAPPAVPPTPEPEPTDNLYKTRR
ncbi:MAG TPA: hypothetical protein VF407_10405, partial [Polyangiaceae bacterium]